MEEVDEEGMDCICDENVTAVDDEEGIVEMGCINGRLLSIVETELPVVERGAGILETVVEEEPCGGF